MREYPSENGMRAFSHDRYGTADDVSRDHLISSCRLYEGPGHDVIHIWNRGGKSGTLTVSSGDGEAIIRKLLA